MSKKKFFGHPELPSQYVVITNPDEGHSGQGASYITLQQAKKLLKDDSVCVYIFKIPRVSYCCEPLLKYPLGEYYSCLEINKLTDEVWCSLNVENLKNIEKDFSEYIELKSSYNDVYKEWQIKIEYHEIVQQIEYGNCIQCNKQCNNFGWDSYKCNKCNKILCIIHNTEEYICNC